MKGLYFLKLCRWCLILIGLVMLVSVLFIMGQLLVDWGNGRAGGNLGIGLASSTTDSGLVYTLSQIRQVNLLILYYILINRIVNMQVAASCRSKAFLCAFQLFILKHCYINLPLQTDLPSKVYYFDFQMWGTLQHNQQRKSSPVQEDARGRRTTDEEPLH